MTSFSPRQHELMTLAVMHLQLTYPASAGRIEPGELKDLLEKLIAVTPDRDQPQTPERQHTERRQRQQGR